MRFIVMMISVFVQKTCGRPVYKMDDTVCAQRVKNISINICIRI